MKFISADVEVLNYGLIQDNDPSVAGYKIFGDDNDYHTLLNGSGISARFEINDTTNLVEELKNSLNTITNINNSDISRYIVNLENFVAQTTSKSDFTTTKFKVPDNRYNGLRQPKLRADYVTYHIDSSNSEPSRTNIQATNDCNNKSRVIVYNEIVLKDISVTSEGVIDHTTSSSSSSNVMQKNADFNLSFGADNSIFYGGDRNTGAYVDHYYIVFDLDVILNQDVLAVYDSTKNHDLNDSLKKSGSKIPAGSWIKVEGNSTEFKAKASSNEANSDIVEQVQNKVMIIAVAGNIPKNSDFTKTLEQFVLSNETAISITNTLKDTETKYINKDTKNNKVTFNDNCDEEYTEDKSNNKDYYDTTKMYEDAYYMVKVTATTQNIGRIYDFKVTDCSDIDFKSVFRKSSTLTSVNDLTGIQYFSGIKELNIYSNEVNTLVDRKGINIGNSQSMLILPLGPYKNTNTSYVSAPKLGYRISFDLKTSGLFDPESSSKNTRVIEITPTYYYLPKTGGNIIENIQLYYKNSSGKYVNLSSNPYTISFKPNDGYRFNKNLTYTNETKYMSDKLQNISIGDNQKFELNSSMMTINSTNNFIQAWYGEFKLPNSTLVVQNNNISNPLNNGYIGVKFDIKCVDKNSSGNVIRTVSYNQNNKNATSKENTTQWDYEGYLGFNDPGSELKNTITMQLENGTLNINNNELYNKIKGTVVLFDIDNRAANDFE